MTEIEKEDLLKTLKEAKENGYDMLKYITAVDYKSYLQVVYFLYSTSSNKSYCVKVRLDGEKPEIESAYEVYKSAAWYERELSEMFGIKIKGKETKRLLLEEWNGAEFPLRKSYIWNSEYKKVGT